MEGLFVFVSEISFLIPPSAYPARCGLLLTTLLVKFYHLRTSQYLKNIIDHSWYMTVPTKRFWWTCSTRLFLRPPPILRDWPRLPFGSSVASSLSSSLSSSTLWSLSKQKEWTRSLILKSFPLTKENQTSHQEIQLTLTRCFLSFTFLLLDCSWWLTYLFIFFKGTTHVFKQDLKPICTHTMHYGSGNGNRRIKSSQK